MNSHLRQECTAARAYHDGIPLHEQVLTLNNHATSLMASGCLREANESLKAALRSLKTAVSSYGLNDGAAEQELDSSSFSQCDGTVKVACSFVEQRCSMPSHDYSSSSQEMMDCDQYEGTSMNHDPYIYTRPMHICCVSSQDGACDHSLGPSEIGVLSYAIVYNLALCHHLWGLQSSSAACYTQHKEQSEAQRSCWRQASQLYTHALRLLSRHRVHHTRHGILHYLAILNNLGVIQARLGNDSQARSSYERLYQAILCFKSSTPAASLASSSEEQGLIQSAMPGFFSNILSSWPGMHNCAPAA